MTAKQVKTIVLLILNAFVLYYILVAGFNLTLRLSTPKRPDCNPNFCSEIVDDGSYCLITTPGFDNCVEIEGYFYILSITFEYSLFALCLAAAFYFSKRFYLSRILLVLSFFAVIIIGIRTFLGSLQISGEGILIEFTKLGLGQGIVGKFVQSLFAMFYPKL